MDANIEERILSWFRKKEQVWCSLNWGVDLPARTRFEYVGLQGGRPGCDEEHYGAAVPLTEDGRRPGANGTVQFWMVGIKFPDDQLNEWGVPYGDKRYAGPFTISATRSWWDRFWTGSLERR